MNRLSSFSLGVALATSFSFSVAAEEKLNVFGTEIIVKVDGSKTAGALTVVESIVPPGSGPPRHVHSREDEMFYVISGQFKLAHAEHGMEVGPGQVVFLRRNEPHTYKNISNQAARLLVTITRAGFEGFLREVSQRKLSPPNDMQEINAVAEKYGLRFVGPPLE